MKNRWIAAILVFCMMLALAGCGKSKDSKKEEETATPVDAAPIDVQTTGEVSTEAAIPMDEQGFYLVEESVEIVSTKEELILCKIEPNDASGTYMYLEAGKTYPRTGYNDAWSRIIVDGTNFFVHIENTAVVESATPTNADTIATPTDAKPLAKKIVIDPANQAKDNVAKEPIGPGSEEEKQGASQGSVGATYGTKEYDLNLTYALALKTELEARGYEVILTRDNNNVEMTNKQRAEFANSQSATVFIRIQVNSSSNSELTGAMALCMESNSPFNADQYTESKYLASCMLQGYVENSGIENRGLFETNKMTAINWCKTPVAVIDLGFISNEKDEGNLVNEEYKKKAIEGISNGIDKYFTR